MKAKKKYRIRNGSIVDTALKALLVVGIWTAFMAILVPIYNAACAGGAM